MGGYRNHCHPLTPISFSATFLAAHSRYPLRHRPPSRSHSSLRRSSIRRCCSAVVRPSSISHPSSLSRSASPALRRSPLRLSAALLRRCCFSVDFSACRNPLARHRLNLPLLQVDIFINPLHE